MGQLDLDNETQGHQMGVEFERLDTENSSNSSLDANGAISSNSLNGNDEDDILKIHLPEDTYGLMLTSKVLSFPFFFSIFIFVFQMLIIMLIIPPIISKGSHNPLNVPADVDPAVRFSQFLSSIIAVMSQGDILQFPEVDIDDLFVAIPGLHPSIFCLSALLRLMEASGVLFTTFCLIVSSSTVIDIFMNFAAMMFIAELDDIAFYIANIGFLGGNLKRSTEQLSKLEISGLKKQANKFTSIVSRLISVLIFISFITGLLIISFQQMSGFFLCKAIKVQFGDEINKNLGFMSGVYKQDPMKIDGKIAFVETRSNGKGRFAYCNAEKAWTFSLDQDGEPNPCAWIAKSPRMAEFDITNSEVSGWTVLNSLNQPLPFVTFSLFCIDCIRFIPDKACSGHGTCIDNTCQCNQDRYGLSCEFTSPCESVEIDVRRETFFSYSKKYYQLENFRNDDINAFPWVQAYERPIYVSEGEYDKSSFDIIIFTGRRWIATKSNKLKDFIPNQMKNQTNRQYLADYFNNEFHGFFSNYEIDYISGATDVLTPDDGVTPVNLHWYHARSDRSPDFSLFTQVMLLCAICDTILDNDLEYDASCFGRGTCKSGICDCKLGSYGVLCQAEICRTLSVIFDDKSTPDLEGFSGNYDVGSFEINNMPVYIERRSRRAIFAYCDTKSEAFWSFIFLNSSIEEDSQTQDKTFIQGNICTEWQIKTGIIGGFDISAIENSHWMKPDSESKEPIAIESFKLTCQDCDKDTPLNEHFGICHGRGVCNNEGSCICEQGYYGDSCKYSEPTSQIMINKDFGGFPSYSSEIFHALRDENNEIVKIYDHPIYIQNNSESELEVFTFVGTRWILTKSSRLGMVDTGILRMANMTDSFENPNNELELAQYMIRNFHGKWSNYEFDFFTEPVEKSTIKYQSVPSNLKWYEVNGENKNSSEDNPKPMNVHLVGSGCDDTNKCQNDGICINDICECRLGYYGPFCEKIICTRIHLQFGKAFSPSLEFFSGSYTKTNFTIADRLVYQDSILGNAFIAYCDKENFWTFTYYEPNIDSDYHIQPCIDWKARSIDTYFFEVSNTKPWMVISDETGNIIVDDDISIACVDCSHPSMQADGTICSNHGSCHIYQCKCNHGWFGLMCDLNQPCDTLEVDPRSARFPKNYAKQYQLLYDNQLHIVSSYGYPVYYHIWESLHKVDIIMYVGRRWVLTHDSLMSTVDIHWNENDIATQLASSLEVFHAYWDIFEYDYTTKLIDSVDTADPVWMLWYDDDADDDIIKSDMTLSTKLLCTTCDSVSNVCRNGGICRSRTGSCDCHGTGYAGKLCQLKLNYCSSIRIQGLEGFSGLYDIQSTMLSGEQRPVYTSRSTSLSSLSLNRAQFQYCHDKQQWGFTGYDLRASHDFSTNIMPAMAIDKDPCNTTIYVASDVYDISTILSSDWTVSAAYDGPDIDGFDISCTSCAQVSDISIGRDKGVCSNAGMCIGSDSSCTCDNSRYGLECEYERPCVYLESASLNGFANGWPSKWSILTTQQHHSDDGIDDNNDIVIDNSSVLAMVYDRPVYISEEESKIYVILFTGKRWVMTHTEWLYDMNMQIGTNMTLVSMRLSLVEYLMESFNSYVSDYKYDMYAEDENKIAPTDLKWKIEGMDVKGTLICAACDDTNKCQNDGSCDQSSRKCICPDGFSGSMCQNMHASCYLQPGVGISFCKCHASCATCGYLQYPVFPENCITCADGSLPKRNIQSDGVTGACRRTYNKDDISDFQCFEKPHVGVTPGHIYEDKHENVLGVCKCHESCRTCYKSPQTPDQYDSSSTCISCADGYGIKIIREKNGIKMGVCTSTCQTGLSQFC